jgi:arylsulfatase A-like enzyme
MTRGFLTLTLVLPALGCLARADDATARPPAPNVVIIYADDLGYADLGTFGATRHGTPRLDRMASEGLRLTDFYVAQAVCSASRTALLTGCYPNRMGILGALAPKSRNGINEAERTLGEVFQSKGYQTAVYGKWHLGHHEKFLPAHHGFNDYFGLPYSNDMYPRHPTIKDFPPLPLIAGEKVIEIDPDQSQLTRLYTEHAVGFIEKNHDRPFFLYLAHTMPHVPIFASGPFRGKAADGLYGDVIQEIDASVGSVLDTIKRLGLDNRTLVIFASDNGPWLTYGNHAGSPGPLREGKGTAFDGGVRVPFVARWPGVVPAGSVSREPVMTIDILPTLAKLIGADAPAADRPIDGLDVWPILTSAPNAKSPHEAYFFYWGNELHAVRSGRWKLHYDHPYRSVPEPRGRDGKPSRQVETRMTEALYDLETDIGESLDVKASHPEVVARLKKLADAMRNDLGDELTNRPGPGRREPGKM